MSPKVRDMLPVSARRSSESAAPRLVVEDLTKTFKGRAAIADVSLSLVEHEFTAVLGPSGAGKTTLFRCIAGLLEPDRGTVRLDADDVTLLTGRDRRRVAFIFQQFNLVSRLTAIENVLAGRLGYVPAWRGFLRRFERADRLLALECLDRVGLLGHAMQRSDTLSGGQQQRVAVARALAQQPRLIVADEPVASLDPNSADSVMTLLRRIARSEGVAIICSLHQPHFARSYADRIIGLSRGHVMFAVPAGQFDEAACAQLYATPETPSAPATLRPVVIGSRE
jgi:phosphonate transport system ATP-binding protein